MDWTIKAIKCEDVFEFLCKKKSVRSSCVSFAYFARRNWIAVAVVSLVRIVREGKHDSALFIGKRYI